LQDLKVIWGKEGITIDAFATAGDSGYNTVNKTHPRWNPELFKNAPLETFPKQPSRVISDMIHLLKRAVGLETHSPELSLSSVVHLFGDELPAPSSSIIRSRKCIIHCRTDYFDSYEAL
jgi:hypothetical protein